ncbi:MAG: hypothetical protein B7Z60_04650 [Ferrovum sp. 37-45-19]|nr:MAG: hypothetical protein B7Z65_02425 [Ferrovum sp. 21-44-67]OYV94476.1 MAG: hypothetical protein B7Z60_04650 [Ferrovum sp. 37-45-19]OZB33900.1 MAG: hypothetical protein B7X47_02765 [Ferrovum sp. 34-44-207]HQT81626.1 acyloxyacyl hydrolase [Ferrovaceae bacterium]HQU06515.1 acyloxyacyl hydrolase [Ferrovaceae bacterium]
MITKTYTLVGLLGLPLIISCNSALASRDGVGVEVGEGNQTDMARLSIDHSWDKRWFTNHSWSLGGYWDFSVGKWNPHNSSGGNHEVNDYSITPVWRISPTQSSSNVVPFFELGIGAHYITNHNVDTSRQMSTNFQFGDHVGAGVSLGRQHDWDVMFRFQHLSNAGIQNPNPGINFFQLRVGHWF